MPNSTLLPEPGATSPRTYTLEDGTVITAERDNEGDGLIVVEDPDGSMRVYRYVERSDGLIEIQEYDENGDRGRTLYYDPEGEMATDDTAAVDRTDQAPPDEPEADDAEKSHLDWRLLAGLVLLLAAAGGLIWWLSKRTPKPPPGAAPPWALRLAHEIGREGAERGPRRGRSQSLVRYADDLRAGPMPDERLPQVADVVSTALFGRGDPGPEAQAWAEATWAEIVAAHPVPGRAERKRAKAATPAG